MPQNPVVHFEMPWKDRERMKKFYERAFGWKMIQYGPEMGEYVMVQTGETDDKGMLQKPGMINGGFYNSTDENASPYPSLVIAVDDINAHMEIVKKEGATIVVGPMDIPGVGKFASFEDTEGNRVSMLQPSVM